MTSPLTWKQKLKTWRGILAIVSCVFIAGGVLGWFFLRNTTGIWYFDLAKLLAGAIIVVGIAGLVSEWPKVTNLLLKGLRGIVKDEIRTLRESSLSDVNFLRGINPNILKAIRIATTKVLSPHIDPSFLSVIEDEVYPSIDLPRRHNYELILTHKLEKLPSGNSYINVFEKKFWTYNKNPSGITTTINQPFTHTLKRIEGINNNQLLENVSLKINGQIIDLSFGNPRPNAKTGELEFKAGCDIIIEDNDVKVERQCKKKIPIDDHCRFFAHYPIENLRVTYKHPTNFKPTLYVFGVKGTLEVITDSDELHIWDYKGWLLREHGFVLIWRYVP